MDNVTINFKYDECYETCRLYKIYKYYLKYDKFYEASVINIYNPYKIYTSNTLWGVHIEPNTGQDEN